MLSVILYGRNDGYGYNLHKRGVLSFNCIAEILTDPEDEIVFVDYNTPNDFPTFPEAVVDLLTDRARKLLKIVRVRPERHSALQLKTHLVAIEPHARNAGLRASNPNNRWVLSTNTDMIFLLGEGNKSLSDLVRKLPDGFYHTPRFDIPESIWEGFNRLNPSSIFEELAFWSRRARLNEIVQDLGLVQIYYAPGDFQLALRSDLFAMDGFDERMILGWHVDSNLAKRLHLLRNEASGDLQHAVAGYHTDHTRQVTPMHRSNSKENSYPLFVEGITSPYLPDQRDSWGFQNKPVEVFALSRSSSQRCQEVLRKALTTEYDEAPIANVGPEAYDNIQRDPISVLPYLLDSLSSYPAGTRVDWFGSDPTLSNLFKAAWCSEQFNGWHVNHPPSSFNDYSINDLISSLQTRPGVMVFDFGNCIEANAEDRLAIFKALYSIATDLDAHKLTQAARIIAINTTHTYFENGIKQLLDYSKAPFSSRILQGYIRPKVGRNEIMQRFHLYAPATLLKPGCIQLSSDPGKLSYGPRYTLPVGRYRLDIECRLKRHGIFYILKRFIKLFIFRFKRQRHLRIEIYFRSECFLNKKIVGEWHTLKKTLFFTVSDAKGRKEARHVEIRITHLSGCVERINHLRIEPEKE